ncbi:beta-N-acetylhexosaminidase [Paenibacillus sp. DMB5]|uniref:beta-N-acetylhexosaminidase n=1 Tax=Paenibacillus sp. DMB5 TaxID=1780103 RepID=UPI00076D45FB|nr:beta-N-acetylhexosaminidase [Paenibacillus sp. DMB5]KUP23030.1 glycoside hydrolase family 3 [Paenibacillus sp. DMB5]
MINTGRYTSIITAITLMLLTGCSTGNSAADGPPPSQASAAPVSPGAAAGGGSAPAKSPTPQPAAPEPSVTPSAAPSLSPPAYDSGNDNLVTQIAGMTLEQKIGQMLLAGIDGTRLDSEAKRMIAEDEIGGIILYKDNISSLKSMISLINALKQSNSANKVPLFMSVDQEGGKVSRMPEEYAAIPANSKVGAVNKTESAAEMGSLLAREVLSSGFNMNFAPVLDINSNPDNPVIGERSFGNNAELVSRLGIAEMKGLASEGAIPVIKHFPGHGDTSVDSHLELPVVNKSVAGLAKLEWLPFQAAVKEGADAVMVAHILYPQLDPDKPASLSAEIIGGLLREQMGFGGVVITDDLTMGAITDHYTLPAAAVDTVLAGSDILLIAHEYSNERKVRAALLESVRSGVIPESRIDESVYRILALKEKYKLTDKPVAVPDLTELNSDIKAWRKTLAK